MEESLSRRARAAEQLKWSEAEIGRLEVNVATFQESLTQATAQRADRRALSDRVTLSRRRAEISGKLSATRAETDRLTPLLASRQAAELRAQREALSDRDAAAQISVARIAAVAGPRVDRPGDGGCARQEGAGQGGAAENSSHGSAT